ncbi:MAG: hypothetical protein ACRC1R_07050 [Cetobacterium sp.]
MKKKLLFLMFILSLLTISACSSSNVNGSKPLDPNSIAVNNFEEGTVGN